MILCQKTDLVLGAALAVLRTRENVATRPTAFAPVCHQSGGYRYEIVDEVGRVPLSRALFHAGSLGADIHGQYLSDCSIVEPATLVTGSEGKVLQDRLWVKLSAKLEATVLEYWTTSAE